MTKFSDKNLMGVEMGKSKIKMTKLVYLGQAILGSEQDGNVRVSL